LSLGDDVTENQLKHYVAFKKIKNIVCVGMNKSNIFLNLSIDPHSVVLEEGFTRNMSNISSFSAGNLQIAIKNIEDFEKAKPLIDRAYNEG